ncbi:MULTISPECIES: BrnA antitoxin family protein [Azotobacter]|uniref:BrnA antitoxin family protein n=1 Tax=Azotobacter TaxID=352 RepID=UPI0000527BB0|nr:BrnA antitoxin family protein [Azotobacter vinelandii]WKN23652.1 BrnA antitoxin family protein [Azotobacter vinelandii]GLK61362.1 hypothetical protein GCM10017624_35250 [Azotobacter vinelandii]SFX99269.1 BrnA antitoxin of type II toxin-antitoxin system [Azotobacter vinelandii]
MDKEMERFQADLLESVRQMKAARLRDRARLRGRYPESRKIPILLTLSTDVLCSFRASGPGWQTRMDAALADWLKEHDPEELKRA